MGLLLRRRQITGQRPCRPRHRSNSGTHVMRDNSHPPARQIFLCPYLPKVIPKSNDFVVGVVLNPQIFVQEANESAESWSARDYTIDTVLHN